MLQQLNQLETEIKHDIIHSEKTQLIPSTSRKVPPQQVQVARSEFSIPTPFVFHVITERRKRAFFEDAINFTDNLKNLSTNFLPFEKHCNDIHSIPLFREHHDSYLYYIQCKTCESGFADVLFTVVFNPVKNINPGIFWKTMKLSDSSFPMKILFVHFLKKLLEANEFLKNLQLFLL